MARGSTIRTAIAALALELAGTVAHTDTQGRAIVIDGDTIKIAGRKVRLLDMDAPEGTQTCNDTTGHLYRCDGRSNGRNIYNLQLWLLQRFVGLRKFASPFVTKIWMKFQKTNKNPQIGRWNAKNTGVGF